MKHANESEWRCMECRCLLGIERDGWMKIKVREAQYRFSGPAEAVCRHCGELNVTTCSPVTEPESKPTTR